MAEDLTILIANLGKLDNLRACLRSIYATTGPGLRFRIVVGFNFEGESDTPAEIAREFPQIELLRAPVKLGYCRAYNQLIARSDARYVLLLDDDTVLRPDLLETMTRFMDEHPSVGVAGCRTENPDGSYQKTTARMYTLETERQNMLRPAAFWDDGVDGDFEGWREVGWLNGHFLLVRREAIEAVGVLDERYYTFQCEADWCLRIRRAGFAVAYVGATTIMHIGGAHSVASSVKTHANLIRSHLNRYYFIRKHYGDAALFRFRAIMTLGSLARLTRYVIAYLFDPARRPEAGPKIAAYLSVAARGFARRPEALPPELATPVEDYAPLTSPAPSLSR